MYLETAYFHSYAVIFLFWDATAPARYPYLEPPRKWRMSWKDSNYELETSELFIKRTNGFPWNRGWQTAWRCTAKSVSNSTICKKPYKTDIGCNLKDEQEDPGSVDLPWDDFVPVPDTEWASSKAEAISILSMVSECLKALFRIGILDSRWLASKLGGANAKRRQFINYGRDHKAKLEAEGIVPTAGAMTVVQSSKATTFAVPENLPPSEFLNLPVEAEDDSVSLVSASTAFNNDTSLRLPSLADLGPDGDYFECPICFTLQSFRMEKSWKIHAYRDLKAYVCTSGGEQCEYKMFGDRDSWFDHELKHHHSLYVCKLCGIQCTGTNILQQHIISEHGPHSDEEVLSLIEHGKLVPSQLKAQDCPFCDDLASILSHRRHQTEGRTSSSIQEADILVSLIHFKRHVATHQEQLAIFAVPRTVDDDEEHSHGAIEPNSEAVSSKDDNSQGHHIGESHPQELAPNCIHLGGLPPGVRKADIYNHLRAKEFRQFDVLKIEKNAGFIKFGHPGDAYRAVANLNGSIFMGACLAVQFATLSLDPDSKVYVVEESHLDNFDPLRAIDEVNAAETHFRTTLLPMCEDFTANPPLDPQQRQDQSTHIVTMIRQEVLSTVNFIEAHNDEAVMTRKTEVLEAVSAVLEVVRAVGIKNRRNAEITAQDGSQGKVHQPTADRCRVKLYKLRANDWEDQGTGYCIARLSEAVNDRKEAHIIINSEEDPGRLILKERVYDGNNFQRQQKTLIVWTQRQTGLDMALSFQDATDLDKMWKVIDAVQRDVTEADLTEEASKATNIDDISIHPPSFRQDIIDTTRARQHESSEENRRPEEERNHHTQVPLPAQDRFGVRPAVDMPPSPARQARPGPGMSAFQWPRRRSLPSERIFQGDRNEAYAQHPQHYQESSDSSDDDFLDGFGHIHDIAKPDAETRMHQEEDRVSQQEQGP
ncbi:hypothetical protein LA080_013754 [Diaporthe eres]|nr:hypothetical protein LA080_013754 [Diaporthe eres]